MLNKDVIDEKVEDVFGGQVVWKEAVRSLRSLFNVPVYVLEYLVATYIDYSDEEAYAQSIDDIKTMLSSLLVRPDQAEKVKANLMMRGELSIIDHISVSANVKKDRFEAEIENIGLKHVPVPDSFVQRYPRLLGSGIWAKIKLSYDPESDDEKVFVVDITPIQLPRVDLDEFIEARKHFSKDEWMALLLRSLGIEPYSEGMNKRRWLLYLLRVVPLVENNFNLVELGPRATGKSFVYREISPYAVLVSGGKTTVASLFYNMSRRTMGLVGYYDTVAFDEVGGLKLKDSYAVQIFKDYMESGGFSRGTDEKRADASIVFNGNINHSIDYLLKTSHLFAPFPQIMQDTALLDRIHAYLPGWEMPKFSAEHFTRHLGLANDYLAVVLHELRRFSYTNVPDRYFEYGSHLKFRDEKAVNKIVSGLIKLIYPDESYTKDDIRELVEFAMEMRLRVKWQLKIMGGLEYFDTDFSYKDKETGEETFIYLPELGSSGVIKPLPLSPGEVYTVASDENGQNTLIKVSVRTVDGSYSIKGAIPSHAKRLIEEAMVSIKSNPQRFLPHTADIKSMQIHFTFDRLSGGEPVEGFTLASLLAFLSYVHGRSLKPGLVVFGDVSMTGQIKEVPSLLEKVKYAIEMGAKNIILPISQAPGVMSQLTEGELEVASYEFASSVKNAFEKAITG